MLEYLFKRPMLLSAILSVIVSILVFGSKTSVLFLAPILILLIWYFAAFKKNPQMVICILTVTAVMISCVYSLEKANNFSKFDKTVTQGLFTVTSEPVDRVEVFTTELEVIESDRLPKGAKIYTYYYNESLNLGDKIEAKLKLYSVKDSTFKKSNYAEKIYLSGTAYNIKTLNEKDFVLSLIDKVRNYIRYSLFENVNYDEASTLCAVTFGDKGYFSDDFYSAVTFSGVSHVMVVSGMHLSVIVLLFTNLSEKLFYNKYVRAIIIVFTVIFLTAVCGFTKSIIRAGFTYLLVAASLLLGRKSTPENALGGAVSIIMIGSPFIIFSVSFALSALSTLGILIIAVPITEFIMGREIIKSKFVLWLVSSVLVSLSALIITMPLVIYYFGFISKVSVITNILISTAVTFALSVTVLALILNLVFPVLAVFMFKLSEVLTKYINYVIIKFGTSKNAVAFLGENAIYVSIILIILILVVLLACKSRLDMIKLKQIDEKIVSEGGGKLKWR